MAKIITYHNVLNPLARTTQLVDATSSRDVLNAFNIDTEGYEVVMSRNQVIIAEDFDILEGDIVAISLVPLGGDSGKMILSIVAMVALSLVAPLLAPYIVGAGYGATGVAATYAGATLALAATQAVIVIGGAMLINSVLAPQTPGLGGGSLVENLQNSPTYSWDTRGNSVQQGNPVPMLYGRHLVVPPLISKYVTNDNDEQYLSVLYAVADGPTDIDISTLKINGESSSNFTNVEVFTRPGEVNQSIISVFDDVITDKQINKRMSVDWVYTSTDGNSVSGFEVGLIAPRGLWYMNNLGKLQTVTAEIEIQYKYLDQWIPATAREVTTSHDNILGYWVKWNRDIYVQFSSPREARNAAIYGMTDSCRWSSGQRVCVKDVELYPRGPLPRDVRFVRESLDVWDASQASYYVGFETYEIVTEHTSALISSKAQTALRRSFAIDSLPKGAYDIRARLVAPLTEGTRYGSDLYVEYLQETISDDFTYPRTALLGLRVLATDQLSGGMPRITIEASNTMDNPAYVCIDILQKSGVADSAIDMVKFEEWAVYCTEKNYTCNVYFDQNYTVRKCLDLVGLLGRGNAVQFGSSWSVIIDKADELPVQGFLFTMGNIVKDSFSEQFLPLQGRANKVEITYYDKLLEYEPQMVEVTNASYDQVAEVETVSISYVGCTTREMALKYAKFLLNCNRYLTITQTFEVEMELIACRVGDVIQVAHDVPQIGVASGRIVNASTTSVELDVPVAMTPGLPYYMTLRYSSNDEVITVKLVNPEDEEEHVTYVLEEELSEAPSKYDVYSVGPINKTTKLMRVMSMSTSQNFRTRITALEYVPEVYDDLEVIEPHTSSTFGINGLVLSETISYQQSTVLSSLKASWRGSALWYDVYLNDVFHSRAYSNYIDIKITVVPATYKVTVKDSFGASVDSSLGLLGRFYPPEAPTELDVTQNSDVLRFSWVKSIALDTVAYEIRTGVLWESAFVIGKVGDVDTFEWYPDMNSDYNFMIKAIDSSGVYSTSTENVLFSVLQVDENLNILADLNYADKDTEPCTTPEHMVFVVGKGYIPIQNASFDDVGSLVFDDLTAETFEAEPSLVTCATDLGKVGFAKVRILSKFSSTYTTVTFDTISNRQFDDYPFDTFDEVTSNTSMLVYYALSDDDVTYSDWVRYTGVADETFRYIKFKYSFEGDWEASDTEIDTFSVKIDAPWDQKILFDEVVTSTASYVFADYGLKFFTPPFVSPVSRDGKLAVVTNITDLGFDIESLSVVDGSQATGTFDIRIKGY